VESDVPIVRLASPYQWIRQDEEWVKEVACFSGDILTPLQVWKHTEGFFISWGILLFWTWLSKSCWVGLRNFAYRNTAGYVTQVPTCAVQHKPRDGSRLIVWSRLVSALAHITTSLVRLVGVRINALMVYSTYAINSREKAGTNLTLRPALT
jgi:hypothetical protein